MKIGIISDIHGNLVALESVLQEIGKYNVDKIFCLGDIVGYGPDSKSCLDLIRTSGIETVRGNHEDYIINASNPQLYNHFARESLEKVKKQLTNEDLEYLKGLSTFYKSKNNLYTMSHHLLVNPENYFILYGKANKKLLSDSNTNIGFIGHIHKAGLFQVDMKKRKIRKIKVNKCSYEFKNLSYGKYFVNVGSVGQPRDCIKDSSFVIFDDQSKVLEFFRVGYNIESVIEQMKNQDIPSYLYNRLIHGN